MRKPHENVERANALSFTEFKSAYVPDELLKYHAKHDIQSDTYNITFKNTQSTASKSSRSSPSGEPNTEQTTNAELEACFSLITQTSRSDYESSPIGWRPAHKRTEMREPEMRYLLVRRNEEPTINIQHSDGSEAQVKTTSVGPDRDSASPLLAKDPSIIGFMSFMLTIEENQDVAYVYEIHLKEASRGQGLGRVLFNITETIAIRAGMQKVMLTVFRCNEKARAMYAKLGYEVDECSPRPRFFRGGIVKEASYLILSKRLPKNPVLVPPQSKEEQSIDTTPQRKKRKV